MSRAPHLRRLGAALAALVAACGGATPPPTDCGTGTGLNTCVLLEVTGPIARIDRLHLDLTGDRVSSGGLDLDAPMGHSGLPFFQPLLMPEGPGTVEIHAGTFLGGALNGLGSVNAALIPNGGGIEHLQVLLSPDSTPTCSDGLHDGDETDRDCGGSCVANGGRTCAWGMGCNVAADCASGTCLEPVHRCIIPRCADGMRDYDETGVDCGGSRCMSCAGDSCNVALNCRSGYCDNGVCR